MKIITFQAKQNCEDIPIGKLSTEKPYSPALARKMRNELYREFPTLNYFRMVEEELIPSVIPSGHILLGDKGGRYVIRVNSVNGITYRRYIKGEFKKKRA